VRRYTLAERIRSRLQALELSSRREKLQYLAQCAWGKLSATLAKRYAEDLLPKATQFKGGARSSQLRALDAVQMANRRALSAYRLRPYPGRVTLFCAEDPDNGHEHAADNGWTEFAKGGIEIHQIPGEHQMIFAQPNVRALAIKLDACIRAALAENNRG
jgi:thioesterase domain-containing protein